MTYRLSYNEILTGSYASRDCHRMTLSYLEWFSNIFNDTKHRPVSATAELFVRQHWNYLRLVQSTSRLVDLSFSVTISLLWDCLVCLCLCTDQVKFDCMSYIRTDLAGADRWMMMFYCPIVLQNTQTVGCSGRMRWQQNVANCHLDHVLHLQLNKSVYN